MKVGPGKGPSKTGRRKTTRMTCERSEGAPHLWAAMPHLWAAEKTPAAVLSGGPRALHSERRRAASPLRRAASPVARAGKHPPLQKVRDDCTKGGLLRGQKQKSWREDDSDSTEDQEDPREEECLCKVWIDGRAHVRGGGCEYMRGTRGCCDCLYKWSMHTPACNGAYAVLPEV